MSSSETVVANGVIYVNVYHALGKVQKY